MAKKRRSKATDKQLVTMSLRMAFETLRAEGYTEEQAAERMISITTLNAQALRGVAQLIYRPFGSD